MMLSLRKGLRFGATLGAQISLLSSSSPVRFMVKEAVTQEKIK